MFIPSPAQRDVQKSIIDHFRSIEPQVRVTAAGYLADNTHNVLPHLPWSSIKSDLASGNGSELTHKFRAVHSSSALAVNCFGAFKSHPASLRVGDLDRLTMIAFEGKCPTGLSGTPPNLDVLAENDEYIVGIDSKFTEHVGISRAAFSKSYEKLATEPWCAKPWYDLITNKAETRQYRHIDVAQLIKHALGLAREGSIRKKRAVLVYLYWEPKNAAEIKTFQKHRDELAQLRRRMKNSVPRLIALSYRQIWSQWEDIPNVPWLANHLKAIRRRYDISI